MVAVLAVLTAVLIIAISPIFEECVKENYNPNSDQSFYEGPWIFIKSLWWCGGVFSKENGDAITALATVVMAVFTGTLWWSSTEQGKIAQGSIDLARAEFDANHRPWLSVTPIIRSDLVFEGRSGEITIEFKMRNSGNSPALNIMVQPHFICVEERAQSLLDGIMSEQTEFYSGLRQPNPMVVGHTLFPRDDFGATRSIGINQDEIERFTGGRREGGFPLILVGSVSYRSPIGERVHHSGFIYELRRPSPESPNLSLLFGSHDHVVPAREVELIRAFQSGFAD